MELPSPKESNAANLEARITGDGEVTARSARVHDAEAERHGAPSERCAQAGAFRTACGISNNHKNTTIAIGGRCESELPAAKDDVRRERDDSHSGIREGGPELLFRRDGDAPLHTASGTGMRSGQGRRRGRQGPRETSRSVVFDRC